MEMDFDGGVEGFGLVSCGIQLYFPNVMYAYANNI